MTPEEKARQQIDAMLIASGWPIQDYKAYAFPLATLVEQTRIVAEAERRLSVVAEELEAVRPPTASTPRACASPFSNRRSTAH